MSVHISDRDPKIYSFLQTHPLGILATADTSGVPHAATIYFVVESDFSIRFITKQQTAKYHNLHTNPQAALAVYEVKSQTTVQLAGPVEEIQDISELEQVFGKIVQISETNSDGHRPPISKLDAGNYVAFRLQPTTVRMAEFVKAEYPPVDEIFEVVTAPAENL
jgi:uncharacterized pyridoxamine 5'-phosphate oxidase family protein